MYENTIYKMESADEPNYDIRAYSNVDIYNILDLNPSAPDALVSRRIKEKIDQNVYLPKAQQFFFDVWDRLFVEKSEETESTQQWPSQMIEEFTQQPQQPQQPTKDPVALVNSLAVARDTDKINPLLTQTRRVPIVIDSSNRDRHFINSTNYIGSLTSTLKNVSSLKLYSYQIPYSWYTINNDFGSNFFLLQATSPGLDNGYHNFTVDISAGNYNPATLITAVRNSIINMEQNNTDVCFGITDISYNINTLLSTLTVDITKRFTETSYDMHFPPPFINPITDPTNRSLTISSFLGYDQQTTPINQIVGNKTILPLYDPSNPTPSDVNSAIYVIDSSNNVLTINQYVPTILFDANNFPYPSSQGDPESNIIQTISVTVLMGTYTRNQLLDQVTSLLSTDPYLFNSSLNRVNRTDASYSYFDMTLTLDQFTTANPANAKIAVEFPDESLKLTTPVWTGPTSCFCFDNSFVEVSDLIAVVPFSQVSYDLNLSATMVLECTEVGYEIPDNNYTIDIPNGTYNLDQYLTVINQAISTVDTSFSGELNQTGLALTNQIVAEMTVDINKSFTTPQYEIDFYDVDLPFGSILFNIFDISYNGDPSGDLIAPFMFSGQTQIGSSYFIPLVDTSNTAPVCSIGPQPGLGNSSAASYLVPFLYSVPPASNDTINNQIIYHSVYDIISDINKSFSQFQDSNGDNTLVGTILSPLTVVGNYLNVQLTVNVQKVLTQNSYIAHLYDTIPSAESSWYKYLNFVGQVPNLTDQIYNLIDYDIPDQPYSQFDASGAIVDNTITLVENDNNFFYFRPLSTANGLYTTVAGPYANSHYNDIRITIPPGHYTSVNQLLNAMNEEFNNYSDNQGQTYGTNISQITIGGQLYAKIRTNINRVFTAADYALVFYNTTDFVKCYLGDTNISNTVWNETLGWILGFRQQTVYSLSQYMISTTAAQLTSDTAINVDLYKYLFIYLDEFKHNRLNDGVVTLTQNEIDVPLPSYAAQSNYTCDLSGNPISTGSTNVMTNNLTLNQIYSLNQTLNAQLNQPNILSDNPNLPNIFAIIPLKTAGLQPGQLLVENGGQLQVQERIYFGPVDIAKFSVRLYTDKGTILDLNNTDWQFTVMAEYIYQKNKT